MYWKISKFLLSHENLNMDKLPGFYQFFYSSDFQVLVPRDSSRGALSHYIFCFLGNTAYSPVPSKVRDRNPLCCPA